MEGIAFKNPKSMINGYCINSKNYQRVFKQFGYLKQKLNKKIRVFRVFSGSKKSKKKILHQVILMKK